MSSYSLFPLWLCLLLPAAAVMAQPREAGTQIRATPVENTRIEYAQVLKVEPVYQTLRATGSEEVCDPGPNMPALAAPAPAYAKEGGTFSRMVGSIRGFFSRDAAEGANGPQSSSSSSQAPPESARRNCRIVQVQREFQRPVAYDVDYIFGGTKYRSRLAEDPGNRIRIRVSVIPDYPVASLESTP
ncbi:MAG: hypothetical protein LBV45_10000 [Xanthomonadaceae bacterium]|jgi:uncharacterized protein YcfJ|nr:hypothetical protein [Xanthomonadaceae bacterium]